jgi:two-component system chemotaxis response regulator CheY
VINPRILVVDDEDFMRATVKAMLRVIGRFVVEEAEDGSAALAMVAYFRPDLVLCDVSMVPMGGLEFVRRLRGHDNEACRGTRVIMLTSDANETTILTAAQLQLNGYLVKPVSPKRLGVLVRAVFNLPDSTSDWGQRA